MTIGILDDPAPVFRMIVQLDDIPVLGELFFNTLKIGFVNFQREELDADLTLRVHPCS